MTAELPSLPPSMGKSLPKAIVVLLLVFSGTLFYLYDERSAAAAIPVTHYEEVLTPSKPSPDSPNSPPGTNPALTVSASTLSEIEHAQDTRPFCARFEEASTFFVAMKTGASEARTKLPIHFDTTFRCTPQYAIFSDLSEEIDGHSLHDTLDTLPSELIAQDPDFAIYREMHAEQASGRTDFTSLLHQDGAKEDSRAWKLDKWKFLPLIEKAADLAPAAEWFLFVEADTNVVWSNMYQWVRAFDAAQPWYIGGQSFLDDVEFAHGGTGYLLSRPALIAARDAIRADRKTALDLVKNECCGDLVLAKILRTVDVNLTASWPMMQGETPASLDYSENHWCYPVVSQHHMSADEIARMWHLDDEWMARSWVRQAAALDFAGDVAKRAEPDATRAEPHAKRDKSLRTRQEADHAQLLDGFNSGHAHHLDDLAASHAAAHGGGSTELTHDETNALLAAEGFPEHSASTAALLDAEDATSLHAPSGPTYPFKMPAPPLTHGDVFERFVRGELAEEKAGWDNLSQDVRLRGGRGLTFKSSNRPRANAFARRQQDGEEEAEFEGEEETNQSALDQLAPTSPAACRDACEARDECLQWRHRKGECVLGRVVRLGREARPVQGMTSGWLLERVDGRTRAFGENCHHEWISG